MATKPVETIKVHCVWSDYTGQRYSTWNAYPVEGLNPKIGPKRAIQLLNKCRGNRSWGEWELEVIHLPNGRKLVNTHRLMSNWLDSYSWELEDPAYREKLKDRYYGWEFDPAGGDDEDNLRKIGAIPDDWKPTIDQAKVDAVVNSLAKLNWYELGAVHEKLVGLIAKAM